MEALDLLSNIVDESDPDVNKFVDIKMGNSNIRNYYLNAYLIIYIFIYTISTHTYFSKLSL